MICDTEHVYEPATRSHVTWNWKSRDIFESGYRLENGSYRYLFSHLPKCWTVRYRSVSASFILSHVGECWTLIGHRRARDRIHGWLLVKFHPSHSFSTVPRGDERWRVSPDWQVSRIKKQRTQQPTRRGRVYQHHISPVAELIDSWTYRYRSLPAVGQHDLSWPGRDRHLLYHVLC